LKIVSISLLAGTIASVAPAHISASQAATEAVLYSFCTETGCPDGETPQAGLVDLNGSLYGATPSGGAQKDGTIFSVDPKSGTETLVYAFCSQQKCIDGKAPYGGLLKSNGLLYGTTYQGGTYGAGTVFAIDPATKVETVLHSFGSGTDGGYPWSTLIAIQGVLYGTTKYGGTGDCSSGCGTVFSLDSKTGVETVLYRFAGDTDGALPVAGLLNVNGKLYGTTTIGGSGNYGTVFSVDPGTGAEAVVHRFQNNDVDGILPESGLVDLNGTLYGTTSEGGDYGPGTVYSLDSDTGDEAVLYSFCRLANCVDGAEPIAGLHNVKGVLYGTAYKGGPHGGGAVFSLDPATGIESVVYGFNEDHMDGIRPQAGLISIKGTLYGTTFNGGASGKKCRYGCGSVFAVTP
jgi:uncharacterized repeat protein (TIGR03803 family)